METLCLGRHLAGASRIALGCMRMASHSLQEASQVLETARQVGISSIMPISMAGASRKSALLKL